MGPRLFSRGKLSERAFQLARWLLLQWGRGFLAAESLLVWKGFYENVALQWGRGFLAAESRL